MYIRFQGSKQIVGKPTDPPIEKLVCVFVILKDYWRALLHVEGFVTIAGNAGQFEEQLRIGAGLGSNVGDPSA